MNRRYKQINLLDPNYPRRSSLKKRVLKFGMLILIIGVAVGGGFSLKGGLESFVLSRMERQSASDMLTDLGQTILHDASSFASRAQTVKLSFVTSVSLLDQYARGNFYHVAPFAETAAPVPRITAFEPRGPAVPPAPSELLAYNTSDSAGQVLGATDEPGFWKRLWRWLWNWFVSLFDTGALSSPSIIVSVPNNTPASPAPDGFPGTTPAGHIINNYFSPRGPQGPQGLTGLQGPAGPVGPAGVVDASQFVTAILFRNQVDRIFDSIADSVGGLREDLREAIETDSLSVSGNATVGGQATFTHEPSLAHTFAPWPTGTSNVEDSSLYINPASSVADGNLLGLAVGGNVKFLVDAEGDIYGNSLTLTGSTTTGSTTVTNLTVQDNTILGDAGTDTVIINANPITLAGSAPVIDTTNPTATLGINTTTNRPVTFGTGLVTANNFASSGAAITGGSINGTPIGATAPSSGAFTSLSSTGATTLGNNSATVVINSSDWDIDATGIATGLGAITSDGLISTSGGLTVSGGDIALTDNAGTTWSITNAGVVTAGTYNGQTISSAANFTGTVALATLGVAGSTAVCYNGSSQLATCTTNPSSVTLQQAYNAGNTITTTDARDIEITLADTTTDQSFEITQVGTALAFRVNDDGTFTDTTPFVVDASGQVGIGTASPGVALDVSGDIRIPAGGNSYYLGTSARLYSDSSYVVLNDLNGTARLSLEKTASGANSYYDLGASAGASAGHVFRSAAGAANLVTILNGGNVGIGTTGPTSALHVYNAAPVITLQNQGTGDGGLQFQNNSAVNIGSVLSDGTTGGLKFSAYLASNAMVILPTSGNVGIGTTGPVQKLHVVGANGLPASSGTTQNGLARLIGSANNALDIGVSGSSPFGAWLQVSDITGLGTNYPLLLNPNGGNVGIGTPSPDNPLTIASTSANLMDFYRSGTLIGTISASSNDLGIVANTENMRFTVTSGKVYSFATGNVGIGDTSPAYLLTVGSGDLFGVDSSSNVVWEGTSADANETTLSVVNPTADITYRLADAAAGTYDLCSSAGNCLSGGGAATLQSAYNAGNTITTTDGRDIEITLADTTTDQTLEITQAGTALAFRVNDDGTFTDTTPFVVDASGNVGIGTMAPTALLSLGATGANALPTNTNLWISGAGGVPSSSIKNRISIGADSNQDYGAYMAEINLDGGAGQVAQFGTRYGGADAPALNLNQGNVGIGTTTPSRQLHVYGAGQATANLTDAGNKGGTIYVQDSGVGVDNGGAVIFGSNYGTHAAIKALVQDGSGNSTGSLAFSLRNLTSDTALTQRMVITSAGLVGIGTTGPNSTLQVNGITTISAGNVDSNNVDGLRFQTSGGSSYIDNHGTNTFFRAGAGVSENAAARTVMTFDNSNGNVGIGTTSPGQKLEVANGQILASGTTATANAQGIVSNQTYTNAASGAIVGISSTPTVSGTNVALYGVNSRPVVSSGVSVTNVADFYAGLPTLTGATVANAYGLYIENISGATNNYSIYTGSAQSYFGGNVTVAGTLATGGMSVAGNLLPSVDNTYDLGSTSLRWKTLHVGPGSVVVHNDATNTLKATLGFSGSTAQLLTDAATPLQITTGANTGINMDTSGNVGIGTPAPGYKLQVSGVNNDTAGIVGSLIGTGTAGAFLHFSNNATGNWAIGHQPTTDAFSFIYGRENSTAGSPIMTMLGTGGGGNVGIGTTAPLTKLHITGASATNVDVLTLENSDITSNVTRSITQNFVGSDTVGNKKTIAAIRSVVDQINANDGSLHFDTRNANTLFPDRMVIDTLGNVGIGTTSSGARLHIQTDTSGTQIPLDIYGYRTEATAQAILIARVTQLDGFGRGVFDLYGSDQVSKVHLSADGDSYIVPQNSGNFGIGTITPYAKLTATGASAAAVGNGFDGILKLTTGTGGQLDEEFAVGIVDGSSGYTWMQAYKAGTSTRAISLQPLGGNVGIGTTSPQKLLHVVGVGSDYEGQTMVNDLTDTTNSAAATKYIIGVHGVSNNRMSVGLASANYTGYAASTLAGRAYIFTSATPTGITLATDNASGDIRFGTGSVDNERMRIDNIGNVGIGTTGPGYKLEVAGTGRFSNVLTLNGGVSGATPTPQLNFGTYYADAGTPSTGPSHIVLYDSTDKYGFGVSGGFMDLWSAGGYKFNKYTGGVASSLNVAIDSSGNVGIGTTAPGGKLDVKDGNLILSNTNVAQPATDYAPANAWGQVSPISATAGGLNLFGLSDTDATGMLIQAAMGVGNPTDATPAMQFMSLRSNGATGVGALGALETAFRFDNLGTPLVTILGSGNVGIGTTGPSFKLDVISSTSDDGIRFKSTGGAANLIVAGTADNPKRLIFREADTNKFWLDFDNQPGGSSMDNALGFYDAAASIYRMVINSSGNVGIGTTTPEARMQITGGGLCVGSDANCNTDNNTEGVVYSSSTAMSVYDVAENYPTKDATLTPGEVVEQDPVNNVFVRRSQSAYGSKLLGIISAEPGVLLGGFNGQQFKEEHQVAVALVGRVPVKVTNENGNIQPGDFLTSSATLPGYAMKATKAGPVVGQALAAFSGSETSPTGTVMVFVKATNYNGAAIDSQIDGLLFDYGDPDQLTSNSTQILEHLLSRLSGLDTDNLSQINTDVVIAGAEVITPSLTAASLRVDSLATATSDGSLEITASTVFADGLQVDHIGSITGLLIFETDVEFFGTPYFTSDTAGFALVKQGGQTVDVIFTRSYLAQPIVNATISFEQDADLSLIRNQSVLEGMRHTQVTAAQQFLAGGISYVITNKTKDGFTIVLNKPATEDIKFSWIALAVKDAALFTSIDQDQAGEASGDSTSQPNGDESGTDNSQVAPSEETTLPEETPGPDPTPPEETSTPTE